MLTLLILAIISIISFFSNDLPTETLDLYDLLDVRYISQRWVNRGILFEVVSRLLPLIWFIVRTFWTRTCNNWEMYRLNVVLLDLNQFVQNKTKCLQSPVPSACSRACFCPKCVHECVVFPLCSPHIYNPFYWNPCHLPPAQSSTLKH